MSGVVACEEPPAVTLLGHAQLELERAKRLFGRARCSVTHTLCIASSMDRIGRLPQARRTRMSPCAWGIRRDDYRWRGDGDRAFSALLKGASVMGRLLASSPLPAWHALMPGTMQQLMKYRSDLYLPDYWLLIVHRLVWSNRMPYPPHIKWLCGESVHDSTFSFVSELPTTLAAASMDALILFREEVLKPSRSSITTIAQPPALRDDQQSLMGGKTALTIVAKPVVQVAPQELNDGNSALPELNDQTFTVSCAGRTYRFTARNKQLFALLERIRRRPGHRVLFDELRNVGDVWDGLQVEDSTITGAVTRLRKLLKTQAMATLAQRIGTGTYQGRRYVVLQTANDSNAVE